MQRWPLIPRSRKLKRSKDLVIEMTGCFKTFFRLLFPIDMVDLMPLVYHINRMSLAPVDSSRMSKWGHASMSSLPAPKIYFCLSCLLVAASEILENSRSLPAPDAA